MLSPRDCDCLADFLYHPCGITPSSFSHYRQEKCQYRARGNPQLYWPHSSYRRRTLPQPKAVILPMVNFGQPQSNGPGPLATADSDIMHHQFRVSLLQWNPGPSRKQPTNIVSAACGSSMRLFYRRPVIMFSTSLISLWPSPTTRTSLSCSVRTLLSLTL